MDVDWSFNTKLVAILDRQEKMLKNLSISFILVSVDRYSQGDATWEREEDVKKNYPYLFTNSGKIFFLPRIYF